MDFIEGSKGVYRPIKELFDKPMYKRALQLCWNSDSYKSQTVLVMELLKLQQTNCIPSQVAAEDMINVIFDQDKNTLRRSLWESELRYFDEEDTKPLLMLAWRVNVSNRMRDVECGAKMLLNSPEAIPPNLKHPKVLSMAQDYARILRIKHETPSVQQLSPEEVAIKVVPKVLQGLWVIPQRTLLNMSSKLLSKMSVGVTKAVLDRVSTALKKVECKASFSSSTRDDTVQSILKKIRQTYRQDILENKINSFAPVLLNEIVHVAVNQITEIFQPQSPKVLAYLKPCATMPVEDLFFPDFTKKQRACSTETNSAVVSPLAAPLAPPAEPVSIPKVQAVEEKNEKSGLEENPVPTSEPESPASLISPAESKSINAQASEDAGEIPSKEKDPNPGTTLDPASVPPQLTPPAEPSYIKVEARYEVMELPSQEKDPNPNTTLADSTAVTSPPTPPAEPLSMTEVQAGEDVNPETVVVTAVQDGLAVTEQPTFNTALESTRLASSPAPLTSPTEPSCIDDVQDRQDNSERPGLKEDTKPTREPASAVPPAPSAPVDPPEVTVTEPSEVETGNETGVTRFFCWLFQPLCCCFGTADTDTDTQ